MRSISQSDPSQGNTKLLVIEVDAIPNTGMDAIPAIQEAISASGQATDPVVIRFQPGRYDLFREKASRQAYYISNTASETENPDPTKTIAVWLKGLKDVTIDGQGALLMLHGEMTGFVVDECENITFSNLKFDMADPSVAEVKVIEVSGNTLVCETLPGSRYRLEDNRVVFVGEGWECYEGPVQTHDPVSDTTWRCKSPFDGAAIEEVAEGRLRLTFAKPPAAKVGWHYQFRHGIRNQVGGFINRSRDVHFDHLTMHFMHGLGIVGQYSENLTFDHLVCEPDKESRRTCAAFADTAHFSGCRGKLKLTNSRFNGTHDDPINVHGTHLRIMAQPSADQILVRFMHPQTYGFDAFFPGDEVDFVRADSLIPFGVAKVKEVERESPREMLLTLDRPVPSDIELDKDVVENVTWTPEVEVCNCSFGRVPTRGILVTTRRNVIIRNNTFFRMMMSAILIADDARSWYESGMIRDVTILGNRFIECGEPVISISPEIASSQPEYVHSNIRILDNSFTLDNHSAIAATSVDGLTVSNNVFTCKDECELGDLIDIRECASVNIEGNSIQPSSVGLANNKHK